MEQRDAQEPPPLPGRHRDLVQLEALVNGVARGVHGDQRDGDRDPDDRPRRGDGRPVAPGPGEIAAGSAAVAGLLGQPAQA